MNVRNFVGAFLDIEDAMGLNITREGGFLELLGHLQQQDQDDQPEEDEEEVEDEQEDEDEEEPAFSAHELEGRSEPAPDTALQSQLCVVCWQNYKNVLMVPCNHLFCCLDCVRNPAGPTKQCPVCRADVESMTIVYT